MKYVIIRGKDIVILFIPNFWESLTIQPPQNKLIDRKWVQNKIKKDLSLNKLPIESSPKYNSKFLIKSYPSLNST